MSLSLLKWRKVVRPRWGQRFNREHFFYKHVMPPASGLAASNGFLLAGENLADFGEEPVP
jgi:hypothetical protein